MRGGWGSKKEATCTIAQKKVLHATKSNVLIRLNNVNHVVSQTGFVASSVLIRRGFFSSKKNPKILDTF